MVAIPCRCTGNSKNTAEKTAGINVPPEKPCKTRHAISTEKPPLAALQLSDTYVMELASGQTSNAQRAVRMIFRNRRGGKLDLTQPLVRAAGQVDGPSITSWQVLDDGIAFDTGGEVHLWRNKASAPAKPE